MPLNVNQLPLSQTDTVEVWDSGLQVSPFYPGVSVTDLSFLALH